MTKILLVEDDSAISKALSIRLRSHGYEVATAADAVFAMTEANAQAPDVVVLDINLPGGDGLQVAERLMNSNQTANTPVVFITASKDAALRERAGNLSACAFLEKPFAAADLVDAIETARAQQRPPLH